MKTLFIANRPEIAAHAEQAGVDVIFVDMETRGKVERQGHLNTHMAAHTLEDVAAVRAALGSAELMVRINPPWEGTAAEVDAAIAAGATRLMLPMFRSSREIAAFKAAVAGRVPVTLLVETAAALARMSAILPLLEPQDRVHFGLNDLSIDMKLGFLFEVVAGRLLDGPAALCREAGIAFGFGGGGRVGQGTLPADWILGEHARLGSEWVILSRAFHGGAKTVEELTAQLDLAAEIAVVHRVVSGLRVLPAAELLANHTRLAAKAHQIAGEADSHV